MRMMIEPRWRTIAAGAASFAAVLFTGALIADAAPQNGKRPASKSHAIERAGEGPLIAVVSIGDQTINVFDKNGRVAYAPVSTGKPGHRTPMGAFSILQRKVQHTSNLYFAQMPYMQRLTWSGVALHAGVIPGYPASHGCIRMPMSFAREIYRLTDIGTRVIVAPDDVAPQPITHANLFSPRPIDVEPLLARLSRDSDRPVTVAFETSALENRARQIPGVMRLGVATTKEADPASATKAMPSEAKSLATLRREAQAAVARTKAAVKAAEDAFADLRGQHAKTVSSFAGLERSATRAAARLDGAQNAFSRGRTVRTLEAAIEAEQRAALEVAAIAADLDAVGPDAKAAREELGQARAALVAARTTQSEAQALVRELDQMADPIHVMVSGKTGKIYVRQGYEPLLEAPVTIENPEKPLGTHVFTAMATSENAATWSVVSIEQKEIIRDRRRAERTGGDAPGTERSASPNAALDRITMPEDVRKRVSELLSPGSSLIVSDEAPSRETGKGTDIIVVTR